MRTFLLVFVASVVMVVCGIAAFIALIIYEDHPHPAAVGLFFIAVGGGFLAPTAVARYIQKRSDREVFWHFRLRDMLIAMTVVAISLALLGVVIRNLN